MCIYRQRQRISGITSHDEAKCSCQCHCQRRRKVNEDSVGGNYAAAARCHNRGLTAVTAGSKQPLVRTAAHTRLPRVEVSTSNSCTVEPTIDRIATEFRLEQSRFDAQVEGHTGDLLMRRTTAAGYDNNVVTAVRRRQRRRRLQHVDISTLRRVSRISSRRRVVSRLMIHRRCSVVVDRRHTADVSSGDDVTVVSTTDSESRLSCLDRAFVADVESDEKWQPDLSPIIAARKRRRAAEQIIRADDHHQHDDIVAHSADSHGVELPLMTSTTAWDSDTVGYVIITSI